MFTYQNVMSLLTSAVFCDTLDDFLAEEGGAIPSSRPYDDGSVHDLLSALYDMRTGVTFAAIRSLSGMSRAEFDRKYSIPIRTMEDWESGKRRAPEYVYVLLLCDILNEEYES